METGSISTVKQRSCPVCNSIDLNAVSDQFIQCNSCKVLIDFTNDNLHVTECPLCGSKELTPLPSGNILCEGCKNSFVARKD
jgi:RNA polymerase subunit RPABC4/transcription elongation factor Spt4